jgi:pyruvate dehydrogenase E1 component alpha subunit
MAPNPDHHAVSHDSGAPRGAGLADLYRRMVLIRRFDGKLGAIGERTDLAGAAHSYAGEEAVAAGAIAALSNSDYVVSNYRPHGHYLARGGEPAAVAATMLNRAAGATQIVDRERRFIGGFGDLRTGLAAAAGLALSCRDRGESAAVCTLFGDAALADGAFYESLRLAAQWKLPIVFVCENNFCGLGTQFDGAHCQEDLHRFAASQNIAAQRVDGAEVLDVYRAAVCAAARARSGGGPSMVDAVTYRLRDEPDFDRAAAASMHHPGFWRQRDPIRIARGALAAEKKLSDRRAGAIERSVEREIVDAIAAALRGGGPAERSPARPARTHE